MLLNPFPKIAAPNASSIVQGFTPSPKAAALLKPEMTPAHYVNTLEQNKLSGDAIKTMSHGMSDRDSVWYACKSSDRVAGKTTPEDQAANKAAEAWVKNPTPATQAAAGKAAAAANYQGPGAWAAQAASFSQSTPGVAAAPAVAGVNAASLTPTAAANSVMLASAVEANAPIPKVPAMPKLDAPAMPGMPTAPTAPTADVPAFSAPALPEAPEMTAPQLAQTAKIQQPYVDLGKDIASGKNTWA